MTIKAIRMFDGGFISQPFAFGGEDGKIDTGLDAGSPLHIRSRPHTRQLDSNSRPHQEMLPAINRQDYARRCIGIQQKSYCPSYVIGRRSTDKRLAGLFRNAFWGQHWAWRDCVYT